MIAVTILNFETVFFFSKLKLVFIYKMQFVRAIVLL